MCASNPYQSEIHSEVYEWSKKLSDDLLPRTRAYHEIWLDEERVAGTPEEEVEPMYGPLYLPRKFKIGIAVPPSNDIDVFSQDLGFIAIVEDGKLIGFNGFDAHMTLRFTSPQAAIVSKSAEWIV